MITAQFDAQKPYVTVTGTGGYEKTYNYEYPISPRSPRPYIRRTSSGQFKKHLTHDQWLSIGVACVSLWIVFWAGYAMGRFL